MNIYDIAGNIDQILPSLAKANNKMHKNPKVLS